MPGDASQRDALAELLWSGRPALPVKDADGKPLGQVTVDGLTSVQRGRHESLAAVAAAACPRGAARRLPHQSRLVRTTAEAADGKQCAGDTAIRAAC